MTLRFMLRGIVSCLVVCLVAGHVARAEPVRVAVYNVELDRPGPGLLLRDILAGAEDVGAVARVITHVAPDILLLTRFDYDHGLVALSAFNDSLGDAAYAHLFARRPNTGMATGLDINRNDRLGEPEDAQSYGGFSGHNGMAILSRFPLDVAGMRDFSGLLWRDLPGARLPRGGGQDGTGMGGGAFWNDEVLDVLRLSTVGHWDVPVRIAGRYLHLWAFHGSPPVFDGPEDRNGLRAADEVRLWQVYLDGALGGDWGGDLGLAPRKPFVILGTANIDPVKGEGRGRAMLDLLSDPRITDPRPNSPGAAGMGDPGDTVDWSGANEPGNLRVDYVLPAAGLAVTGAGVFWPGPQDPLAALLGEEGRGASRHRLVWVDIDF